MIGQVTIGCEKISLLCALRVSSDLTETERRIVDDHVRQCPECQSELEAYEAVLSVLAEHAELDSPDFSDVNLWPRLEPHLNSAYQTRPKAKYLIPTWQLAVACSVLLAVALVRETGQMPKLAQGRVVLAHDSQSQATEINRLSTSNQQVSVNQKLVAMQMGTTPTIQVDMLNVPDLGIDLIDTRQLPYSYQRPCEHGWVIHNVRYGSLGQLMGLRKGDVIIGVNHHYSALPASAFVEPTKPTGATLTVRRHNQIMRYQLSK